MNTEAHNKQEAIALLDAARHSIGVGTLVTLKTGGPAMVVSERSAEKAHTIWHADSGELCQFWFPICVLKVKP
ncbi:MAG: DUF2158 domain-containing protein [Chloracidobacterium sp.]|nr:DUF2158 domain-containing protein [Chloracidobacterium sp.]